MALYLEDLHVGMKITTGSITVSEADAIAYAKQFDPQPFHTDPVAAKDSFFQGLAVSGWHVASLAMRMLVDCEQADIANGLIGIELRHLRWPQPTRPGDTLQLTVEVLETRRSKSRPGWGTALLSWLVLNQDGKAAMQAENVCWVACRES